MYAVPFDEVNHEVAGHQAVLLERVSYFPSASSSHFAVSREGTLAYFLGGTVGEAPRSLAWVQRDGEAVPLGEDRLAYRGVALSPDGQRLVLQIRRRGNMDLRAFSRHIDPTDSDRRR